MMVEISSKPDVLRISTASGRLRIKKETAELIKKGLIEKGNVVETAKIAAIQAIKNTYHLIPMTHPIPITGANIEIHIGEQHIDVKATVKTVYKTGVEIEALVGVATALITIWDMIKKYEKDESGNYPQTYIEYIKVDEKIKDTGTNF